MSHSRIALLLALLLAWSGMPVFGAACNPTLPDATATAHAAGCCGSSPVVPENRHCAHCAACSASIAPSATLGAPVSRYATRIEAAAPATRAIEYAPLDRLDRPPR